MRLKTTLPYLLFVYYIIASSAVNGQLPDDWIDPMDPLSHDPSKTERDYNKYLERKKMGRDEEKPSDNPLNTDDKYTKQDPSSSMESCPKFEKCLCEREKQQLDDLEKIINAKPVSQMPYFKQFVARFASRVKHAHRGTFSEPNYFQATVALTDGEMQILQKFGDVSGEDRVRDAHVVLDGMVKSVVQIHIPDDAIIDWRGWFVCVSWVVTAVSCSMIAINLQWRMGIPWMKVVGSTIVILFLVSVPWTWWHLYQKELATRMSKSQMEAPVECRPQDMDLFQYIMSGLSMQDKCKDFYHSIHVDPWVEITPTKAIAVTITKFVLEPLEHLGESLGKMIKACLMDLPVQLWPVALVFMLIVFIMLLVMGFGYKIRLFYLFGLEPSTPAIQTTDRQMVEQMDAMRNQIRGLQEQSGGVQHMLEDHMKVVEEQLGQPQPQAVPSIMPGELVKLPAPYPAASSTPYPAESGDIANAYMASRQAAGSVPPPGFVTPRPCYTTVATPIGRREVDEDSHIEDVDFATPDEASVSHVFSPNSSRVTGNGKNRRRKVQAIKTLSDSSIATQCGHTQEEDKIASKGQRKSSRDQEQSQIDELTIAGLDSVEQTLPMARRGEQTIHSGMQSSFDCLARSTMSNIGETTAAKSSQRVEDVGSQDTKRVNILPEDSSDDSDLEIIDEEPELAKI